MRVLYNTFFTVTAFYVIAAFLSVPVYSEVRLPEIGSASSKVLSIPKEKAYGSYLLERIYQYHRVIDDPVLTNYLDDLGQRLVNSAEGTRFRIRFLLVQDGSINASAYLGGIIVVHTGLFEYATSEDEIAAVLAHEISHITQRHIARFLEREAAKTPLTLASYIASFGLAFINPQLGLAALGTTATVDLNSTVSFTRENEYEADRIGMNTLYQAGFNPYAMSSFFEKLAAKTRHRNTLPPMLRTHPVPETRIAEARNRARQYPMSKTSEQLNFHLAKARIEALYSTQNTAHLRSIFTNRARNADTRIKDSGTYGLALLDYRNKNAHTAQKTLKPLHKKNTKNLFYLDAHTDIALAQKDVTALEKHLERLVDTHPHNRVFTLNLANLYLETQALSKAENILVKYTRANPDNRLGWSLLMQAYYKQRNDLGYHQSSAQLLLIEGKRVQAINALKQARKYANSRLLLERIDAQIEHIEQERLRLLKEFS